MMKFLAVSFLVLFQGSVAWGKVIEERSITNGYHSSFVWALKKHVVNSKTAYSLQKAGPGALIKAIRISKSDYQNLVALYDSVQLANFKQDSRRTPASFIIDTCKQPVLGFSQLESTAPQTAYSCLEKLPKANQKALVKLIQTVSTRLN